MIGTRFFLSLTVSCLLVSSLQAQALPGTKLLETKNDLAAQMVDGIDKYLSRELAAAPQKRKKLWQLDFSSPEAYARSVQPHRERFKKIIGLVDQRLPVPALEYVADTNQPAVVAEAETYKVYRVRWPVLPGVFGEGLLLEPKHKPVACVVAIPDADWTPEMLVGLAPGVAKGSQFARRLAENGCRVVVPTLINRQDTWSGKPVVGRMTNQTHREFIYRMAYEMGRHIIGYEVQKVLAVVDWFTRDKEHPPVGVFGYGEGGLLALYSAAVDTRIQATVVSGYFGPRENLHEEPIYRNIWGLVREFGDGELLNLIIPRALIVEAAHFQPGPAPPAMAGRAGAAPGSLSNPPLKAAFTEFNRTMKNVPFKKVFPRTLISFRFGIETKENKAVQGPGFSGTYKDFLAALGGKIKPGASAGLTPEIRQPFDAAPCQKRQFEQLVSFTQKLLPESARKRQEFFWNKLNTASLAHYEKSTKDFRDFFHEEIIGKLPKSDLPFNPRTRLVYETPKWNGYEVVLDLYEEVICYGILLVPNDLKPGEKRPVVVCQHGLEGRPTDVCNPKKRTSYYNSFGAQLADRGYIVFAPQNPYIFHNKFRQVARKANSLKLSLYSFIVRQHERIIQWLKTLPFVDGRRIAYYGLSYGGKVAMRIPAILLDYCLSICSGDFNEWIWKNITLDWANSYMFTGEYEMYEFNLGNTFNYAEMAALIAPRPFMVERGHSDGVGLDEYVAFEYAKVRRHCARLGLADRTAIEFFSGGHEIHGQGTFAFLERHLHFTPKSARGTVKIESNDPTVEIVFDKTGPIIKGADKEPITLPAGQHGLLIKRGDFAFETDKLVLKKGQTVTLKIELLGGHLRLLQDGKVLVAVDLPSGAPRKKSATGLAPAPRGLRVFSAGHSFHVFVPGILSDMAKSAGIKDHVFAGLSSIGGSRVIQHWNVPEEKNKAKKALRAGRVDVLTLSPLYLPDDGIEKFARLALENNPNIRVTVQEFWLPFDLHDPTFKIRPRKVDHNAPTMEELRKSHAPYFQSMDDHVRALNKKLGKQVLFVVPLGQAVLALREKIVTGQAPGLKNQEDLFTDAIGHARPPLQALAAYCHFAVIYRRSPVGLPMPAILKNAKNSNWDARLNYLLQELAWKAVISHPLSGVKSVE